MKKVLVVGAGAQGTNFLKGWRSEAYRLTLMKKLSNIQS